MAGAWSKQLAMKPEREVGPEEGGSQTHIKGGFGHCPKGTEESLEAVK